MNINHIEQTMTKVVEFIKSDSLNNTDASSAENTTKLVLNSNTYFSNIKVDVDAIMSDGKIGANDIPRIMSVVLKSSSFVLSLKKHNKQQKLPTKLPEHTMKYIAYGLCYMLMLNAGSTNEELINFELQFPALWFLCEMSLPPAVGEDGKVRSRRCC
jgi:hypothetical protein